MTSEKLVNKWFQAWQSGNVNDLPIAEKFKHTSPFGTINGKQAYIDLVQANRDKFMGYTFEIHDSLYEANRACIRYTARQGKEFALKVSEWHYIKAGQIQEIIAYYHIGNIREDRKLKNSEVK